MCQQGFTLGGFTVSVSKIKKPNQTPVIIYQEDILSQKYSQEEILSKRLQLAFLYEKQLDNPLGFVKKSAAFLLFIKQKHQFVVVNAEQIYISVDYFDRNGGEVQIRICQSMDGILQCQEGKKRGDSKIVQEFFKGTYQKAPKFETLEDLIKVIHDIKPNKPYNQVTNNCHKFVRQLYDKI